MKQVADQAIVLGRIDFGERDRILTLLTCQYGKISVLAKSVRTQKSRLAGGVELLSTSNVTFIEGKSDLKTLTGARLIKHYGSITKEMARMQLAFDTLKIIGKLCEEGSGSEYYPLLETFLATLDDETYDPRLVEVWIGVKLLSHGGAFADIKPEFAKDTKDPAFEFDYDSSQFVFRPDGAYSLNDLKLLRLSLSQPRPLKLKEPSGSEDRLVRLIKLLLKSNLTEV